MLLSLRGISSRFQLLFPSQGQVLTRYSPVRHWKHHFPSDLHVLSMPPAFILSQDRTLHEIHSCITYSFLVRRQSGFGIVFQLVCIHALHIRLEFAPRKITPERQSYPFWFEFYSFSDQIKALVQFVTYLTWLTGAIYPSMKISPFPFYRD